MWVDLNTIKGWVRKISFFPVFKLRSYFPAFGLEVISKHHGFSWFSGPQTQTGAVPLALLGLLQTLKFSTNIIIRKFHIVPPHVSISEKAMATHSSTLAWKIPWMEEPGRLQSMGSLRVGHDWETSLSLFTFMHWRRKWQPTPVFLPGESQGRGSLWAAVYGVTQSRTWLKQLSSSSTYLSITYHFQLVLFLWRT